MLIEKSPLDCFLSINIISPYARNVNKNRKNYERMRSALAKDKQSVVHKKDKFNIKENTVYL
jgi:hypothetical protein